MERSTSQKVLLVLSILTIIGGVIALFGALFFSFGAGMLATAPASETAELTAETGLGSSELAGMVGSLGIFTALGAIVDFIEGILGIRAANDNQKIKPVYYLSIISLVISAIGLIMTLVNGKVDASSLGTSIGSIVLSALMVWLANNIKKEANL